VLGRHRPDAPARPERLAQEPVDDGVDPLRRHDPAPEQVAVVRAERVDLLLVAVERERVIAAPPVDPVGPVEALLKLARLALEPIRELAVAPDLAGELGGPKLRVVDVAL